MIDMVQMVAQARVISEDRVFQASAISAVNTKFVRIEHVEKVIPDTVQQKDESDVDLFVYRSKVGDQSSKSGDISRWIFSCTTVP